MAAPRRRKIGHRRRVEDEGEDEGGPGALDLDDDSLTDGSDLTDDNDAADDSDTSNVEDASPTSANVRKPAGNGNGAAKSGTKSTSRGPDMPSKPLSDTALMLHGLALTGPPEPVEEMHFDELVDASSPPRPVAPVIVSSASASRMDGGLGDRRRREHEEYKRQRDEDPSFVPNRGAFFMHDHRHAGPAANGFRPFSRQLRGRGGGRGAFGGHFAPVHQLHSPTDPMTTGQWAHDMHEAVAESPPPPRPPRRPMDEEGPPNGNGIIPTCHPSATPIDRTLSFEKHIGNVPIRVFVPPMEAPVVVQSLQVKQYTKLPDHRPPLRRDKPVRISLPNNPPRYIFPAVDRSFIFIPRAMRPNQQRGRGKPARSGLGSIGGWSRRTSVFGGSYYGSAYSPSIALSRRSSLAPDGRDYMFSPTGSVVSRPPMPPEPSRPVVRLPPPVRQDQLSSAVEPLGQIDQPVMPESSITDIPPPQTHPLPQKPIFQEHRPSPLPMHQPRPQKTVSVADIESPTLSQHPPQQYQQAFHQQVPLQVSNGFPQDTHARHPSYPSQHSTGTPLSQIPERAIHAAPFQPNTFSQGLYGHQPYQVMQPPQGYYYPPAFNGGGMAPSATAAAFVPAAQQGQPSNFTPQSPPEAQAGHVNNQAAASGPNLIAQEVNGMVYYYDPTQLPAVNPFQTYPTAPGYVAGVVGMGSVVTPSPDGFFPYQAAQGMVYYPQ